MVLADLKDLTIDTSSANANVTLPNIDGTAGDGDDQTDFTVDAGSGTVDVQSIDTDINDIAITGATITLNGDITTAAGTGGGADAASIDLNGAVVIAGGTRTLTSGNGTIDFSSTVNSEASQTRALELVSGSGAVAINGTVGAGTDGALGNLTINSSGAGNITLSTVGADGAAGAAVMAIGNGDTGTLTLSGVDYHSGSSAQTYTANNFLITGTDPTFTASNAAISFADGATGDIILSDAADLTIRTSGGNIDIEPEIIGTADNANTTVTLNAGGGNVILDNTGTGVIHTDIGAVAITGATIELSDNITTDNANITLTGAVALDGGNVVLTSGGGDIELTSTVDTKDGSAARNLTIANTSGSATITGAIGTGTNGALANLTIGSSGAGAITLTGAIGGSGSAGAAIIAIGNADTATLTMGGADYNTSGAQTFIADDYNLNGTDITFTTSADNVTFTDGGDDGSIDLADAADLTISTSNGAIAIGVPILGTAGDEMTRQMSP